MIGITIYIRISAKLVRSIFELSSGPGTPVGICPYTDEIPRQNKLKTKVRIYFIANFDAECSKKR